MSGEESAAKAAKKTAAPQDIVNEFKQMREGQQLLISKVAEFEGEISEHRLVMDTLAETDGDRKCYRLINGVLVERTVTEVLPSLQDGKERMERLTDGLQQKIKQQGEEINVFREKHNIRFVNEMPAEAGKTAVAKGTSGADGKKQEAGGILVG